MEQLLELRTIPIIFDYKMHNAKYEVKTERPSHEMTREAGGLTMKHKPARMNMDSTNMMRSLGRVSSFEMSEQSADRGRQYVLEAIGRTVEEGNAIGDVRIKDAIPNMGFSRVHMNDYGIGDTRLGFVPSPIDITVTPYDLQQRYEMDRLTFDWKLSRPQVEFTAAKVEYFIKQYPRLEVKYVGDPLYAPPSSNPNYKPLDVMA